LSKPLATVYAWNEMAHLQRGLREQGKRRAKAPVSKSSEAVPEPVVEPETLLGYRLWQEHYLWHKHIERELRAVDLSHLQYVLLAATNFLIREGEAPSQIRLSNFTKVEKMMVSKTLRMLERRGYLSRKPYPGDRRANRIRLTAAGTRLLRRTLSISATAHAEFFRTLGDDWKRLNQMLQALMESNGA
jgi:DNA-binding MarR family transcriptional regulator